MKLLFTLSLIFTASPIIATPFLGDAGAASSSADGVGKNPANAGYVSESELFWIPQLLKSEKTQIRYPGFETTEKGQSGLGDVLTMPSYVYKISPNMGAYLAVLPPGIGADLKIKDVPIVVFDQVNSVDVSGRANINGLLDFKFGQKINNRIGWGIGLSYASFVLDISVSPSEGGGTLVDVSQDLKIFNLTTGLRFNPTRKIHLGLAVGLLSNVSSTMELKSGIGSSEEGEQQQSSETSDWFRKITVGSKVWIAKGISVLADFTYKKAQARQELSLNDFKNYDKDVYDTVSMGLGAKFKLDQRDSILSGFRYEPASVGPGGSGEGDSIGYSSIDVIYLFAPTTGEQFGMGGGLRPYWQIAAGYQRGFIKKKKTHKNTQKQKTASSTRYQLLVTTGAAYRRASLGIDADGTLPGAYLSTKLFMPVQIQYKF